MSVLELLTERKDEQLPRYWHYNHNHLRSCGSKHDMCSFPHAHKNFILGFQQQTILNCSGLHVGDQQGKATELLSHSILKLSSHTSYRNWSLLWVLYSPTNNGYAKTSTVCFYLILIFRCLCSEERKLLVVPHDLSKHFHTDFMEHMNFNSNCFEWFHTEALYSTGWALLSHSLGFWWLG